MHVWQLHELFNVIAPPPDYEAVISAELQQLPRYADTVDTDTGLPGYEEAKLEMGTADR